MSPVNADKPHRWKADIVQSVDLYNNWFIQFAPKAYRDTRVETTKQVEVALERTSNLTNITPDLLRQYPAVLPMLRMATAPPIARDRLIGLAGVSANLVGNMELYQRLPPRATALIEQDLEKIGKLIMLLADKDIFPWLETNTTPSEIEVHRAATIVADRLCGAVSDPIVRNAQERRQLACIKQWLEARGYTQLKGVKGLTLDTMPAGTFSFRLNVPVTLDATKKVNIPIDTVIMPRTATKNDLPLLIEAKSAGDYTNTNKRRKEEAVKLTQLKKSYGDQVRFVLFLCGYFDSGYLGYEAAEGIDWVWEHRIDDLAEFGV
jgi:XamI restriction endonuclease